jgi:hypothetical protein
VFGVRLGKLKVTLWYLCIVLWCDGSNWSVIDLWSVYDNILQTHILVLSYQCTRCVCLSPETAININITSTDQPIFINLCVKIMSFKTCEVGAITGGPTSSYAATGIPLEFISAHKPPHPATKWFQQGGDTIKEVYIVIHLWNMHGEMRNAHKILLAKSVAKRWSEKPRNMEIILKSV